MRFDLRRDRNSTALRLALAATAVALLAGCANRDSVTVGSIPDDYRTRHPIVVSEKEQSVDVPVAATDRGVTITQRDAVEGFIANYDRSAAPPVTILTPYGSQNEIAANNVAQGLVHLLKKNGVPASRIAIAAYQADAAETAAPIRVSYVAMMAHTSKCGRWPDDLTKTSENKNYANFGCSYQNNLAAQIANPADLLGPRKPGEIDAERRNIIIDDYRNASTGGLGEVQY
ncbi:MAG: CpaD family pilus assembly protein [Hyphomicrobiales bacterium]|jgi:pilus assembly protein CpaD|nr:CpaD family pilus assembly protein [Hyphomicrobiales bacterium]MCO5082170.1 CpaD family pilus assembly protein [Rhizobiaceae bacterium]